MKQKTHPHTGAVKMAGDDFRKVVKTFTDGPKFMQDEVDPRTKARHEALASLPADVQKMLDEGRITQSMALALKD